MLDSIPATMFDEWMAKYQLDPWGEQRADLRMGMIVAKIHNSSLKVSKESECIRPIDQLLFPDSPAEKPKQTEAEMKSVLMGIAARIGGVP